jgi:hypothetical protein
MEHEPAARLDRPAVVDCLIRRVTRLNSELFQQAAEPDPGTLVANANSDSTVFIMDAEGGNAPLKTRVGHARHGEK